MGILEVDTIKQVETKEKNLKKSFAGERENLMKGINTRAVPLVRFSVPFLKWTREELQQMDQRTRKLLTMHKALYHRDDVNICVKERRSERTRPY